MMPKPPAAFSPFTTTKSRAIPLAQKRQLLDDGDCAPSARPHPRETEYAWLPPIRRDAQDEVFAGVNSEKRREPPSSAGENGSVGGTLEQDGQAAMAVGAKIPGVPTSVGGRQMAETTVPARVGSLRYLIGPWELCS